jgi:hypothetical protein
MSRVDRQATTSSAERHISSSSRLRRKIVSTCEHLLRILARNGWRIPTRFQLADTSLDFSSNPATCRKNRSNSLVHESAHGACILQSVPTPSAAPTRRPKVRGSAVRMRREYVEARFGTSAIEQFDSHASPQLTEIIKAAKHVDNWVEFSLFVEATELVDRLFGRGDLFLARDIGRFAAEHNMGVWKALFLRVITPNLLMNISGGLWGHHYDAGRLTLEPEGPLGLRFQIRDFPTPHRAHCFSVEGWAERSLEYVSPKGASVSVREESCRVRGGTACEFKMRWK